MGLIAKKKAGSSIPPVDGGTYIAVCVGIIDIGEQLNEQFKKYADNVLILWELPSETVEIDGEQKPRWLSKSFTVSLNEKSKLYQYLNTWLGRKLTDAELEGFDLTTLIGRGCFIQVQVEEKENGLYNSITGVMAPPAGIPIPSAVSEKLIFNMETWDDAVFEKLPEWMQNKIKRSTQYQRKYAKPETIDFPKEEKLPGESKAAPSLPPTSPMPEPKRGPGF